MSSWNPTVDTTTVEFRTGDRSQGRTLAWVQSLPTTWANAPVTLVVHTNAMASYLRQMLCDVRPDLKLVRILVFSCERDCERLRGIRFDVDHAVWDYEGLTVEAKQLLRHLYGAQKR